MLWTVLPGESREEVVVRQTGVKRTTVLRPTDVVRRWWVVDAAGRTLGRMATRIATILMGKHKPGYTPFLDTGDFVVVTNAAKVVVSGRKAEQRVYRRWSGYPGGYREEKLGSLMARKPERVVSEAVRRMIPKGILGKKMLLKLKVYAGPDHPHEAQKPEPLVFGK